MQEAISLLQLQNEENLNATLPNAQTKEERDMPYNFDISTTNVVANIEQQKIKSKQQKKKKTSQRIPVKSTPLSQKYTVKSDKKSMEQHSDWVEHPKKCRKAEEMLQNALRTNNMDIRIHPIESLNASYQR